MTMHVRAELFAAAFALALVSWGTLLAAQEPGAESNATALPGGRAADTALAVNDPHEYAWRLFLGLCRQARAGSAGLADAKRPTIREYDPDQPVVWETWALSNGGRSGPVYVPPNRSEVFRDRGEKPPPWNELPRGTPQPKVLEPAPGKGLDFVLKVARAPGKFDPVEDDGEGGVEVRMNRATYDYIRDKNLYSIEGLEARFHSDEGLVFPPAAQEIKARWVRIEEAEKPRYHWRTAKTSDGEPQLWGLSALHIITRDLPNWFWCDFEHVDYERHAEQYSQDTTTRGENPPAGRDGIRNETRGTKWETMRLRGTQVEFVDLQGRPTILANTQLEHGFQQSSSCMTCHSRATVAPRSARPDLPPWQANSLPIQTAIHPTIMPNTGAPNPDWFRDEFDQRRYLQTHFIWSLPFRAMSSEASPPR
jgi:hypothetical protein